MTIIGTMVDIRISTFKLADLCPTNACENSGTCLIGMDGEPYCSCSAGYSGDACEIGNQAEILQKITKMTVIKVSFGARSIICANLARGF